MRPSSISVSIVQLLRAVKRIEHGMRFIGLPRFLARLPVGCLCWYYCKLLDEKIARIGRVGEKIRRWRGALQEMGREGPAQTELIDMDKGLHADLESTRKVLWELREVCLDVARMFERLGVSSTGLLRRQHIFLRVLEESYASAGMMQELLATHDKVAIALLQQLSQSRQQQGA
jgi:hypothetical protein